MRVGGGPVSEEDAVQCSLHRRAPLEQASRFAPCLQTDTRKPHHNHKPGCLRALCMANSHLLQADQGPYAYGLLGNTTQSVFWSPVALFAMLHKSCSGVPLPCACHWAASVLEACPLVRGTAQPQPALWSPMELTTTSGIEDFRDLHVV